MAYLSSDYPALGMGYFRGIRHAPEFKKEEKKLVYTNFFKHLRKFREIFSVNFYYEICKKRSCDGGIRIISFFNCVDDFFCEGDKIPAYRGG